MRTSTRTFQFLLATVAMLAVSFPAFAYEVHVLEGKGAESKLMDKGDYGLAIKRLVARIEREDQYMDVQLTNLCTAYVATGQLDKAIDACDRAIEASGEFVGTAFNSRGVLKALQGDYIAAMEDFEQAGIESNYPVPRSDWGDRAPSMRRYTVETEAENSIELAARNFAATDRTWAAIREEAEGLTAKVEK